MKRILVLDANQRSALAVTRSLGNQGTTVFTAEESPSALAGSSRFSHQYLQHPSPRQNPDQFLEAIARFVKQHNIDMLLPMTELTTSLLLNNEHLFDEVALPFPDIKTVDSIADKCSLMRQAEKLGIPIPRTWYADNPEKLPVKLDDISYPLVLKPGRSWLRPEDQWVRAAVHFANNASEARDILSNEPAFRAHPFLLQECVPGHGEGIFALYDHGKPLAFFAHRRLREKPPEGGVSVLSESIAINPDLLSHARHLLNEVNWHGIAMVEFKVAEDGTPYLMEINTRFWGSLQLAVDAGVDFPWLLYQVTCDTQPAPVKEYKIGIRLRWLLGDLDHLYLVLRDRKYPVGKKLKALARFLMPSPFKTRHEVNRWNDLAPAWYEVKQYLGDILK